MDELKVGTWFSGIGAPEQAIKELGIPHRNVMAAEWDKYAQQTYLANFTTERVYEDVKKIKCEEVEQLDLFIAGFPCQAFSLAGKRLGFEETRGTLFFNTAEFIKVNQPKYFILENVKGLLSHDRPKGSRAKYGRTFNTIINLLASTVNYQQTMFPYDDNLGYNIHYMVLNSKKFGVPQNRERIFIVGIRPDLPNDFRFPIGWPLTTRLKDILEQVVDEKYYLNDKTIQSYIKHLERHKANGNGFGFNPVLVEDNTIANCVAARDDSNFLLEPFCVALRGREDADKEEFGPKNKQQLEPRQDGITNTITSVQKDNLIFEPELSQVGQLPGFEQTGRVYSEDGISCTIKANGGGLGAKSGLYETNARIRRLTPLECFRLQAFPDSYIKPCSDSQTYKQAGNSITVSVIKAVIQNLLHITPPTT